MAGWVERPSMPRHTTSAAQQRRSWLLSAAAAVVLHLVILVAIVAIPNRPIQEDATPPTEVISLILEQPAVEVSPDASPPAAAPTPLEGDVPIPLPLSAEPPPEQPPLPQEPPPDLQQAPAVPSPQPQAEEPQPQPQARPLLEQPQPEPRPPEQPPREQPPAPPAIRKTVQRPPVFRPRPALAPPGAGPIGGSQTPAAPAEARPVAPNPNALGAYQKSLADHVKAYQRYPALARSRREEGLVIVRVTIQRDGRIAATSIEQGSGYDRLDREALATLKRADPLPAMPAAVPGETIDLTFPLRFHLE
jgi:protein TonB